MTYSHTQVEGARVGQISTGIMHPERGYADGFNFFDPDSYLTVQALGLASNAYLDEQVRAVIERTGMFLCPSGGRVGNETCIPDQVPHHFIKDVPVYTAISGERQTGPNVFWTLAALSHGKQTGDLDWLCAYLPTLRKSLRFLKVDKPLANAIHSAVSYPLLFLKAMCLSPQPSTLNPPALSPLLFLKAMCLSPQP
jgi:hypothetical protein